MSKNHCTK